MYVATDQYLPVFATQLQKKRLQTQQDDHKTERDKLFAEQRAIKDTIRGPSNLQVWH